MQHTPAIPGALAEEIPRLSRAWRWPARLIWWGMLLGYGAFFIAGVGPNFRRLAAACAPPACVLDPARDFGVLSGAQADVLAGWGVSLQAYAATFVAIEVLIAVLFGGLGLVIYLRRGEERLAYGSALLIALVGIFLNPSTPPSAIAVYPWLGIVHTLTHSVGLPAFGLLILTLPDGRFALRWSPWLALVLGLSVWLGYTTPTLWPQSLQLAPWLDDLNLLITLVFISTISVGAYGAFIRYRRGDSDLQRQQLKWIALALAAFTVMPLSGLIAAPIRDGLDPRGQLIAWLIHLLGIRFGMLGFVICLSFAVLRYRLWDVDLVLRRVLVYGALSAAVVALYALVVGALGAVLNRTDQPLLGLAGALVAAVAFQPLRSRLQGLVNRALYGQRDQPELVLARLGRELAAARSPDRLVARIEATIKTTLRLPEVTIRLIAEGGADGQPDRSGDSMQLPHPWPISQQERGDPPSWRDRSPTLLEGIGANSSFASHRPYNRHKRTLRTQKTAHPNHSCVLCVLLWPWARRSGRRQRLLTNVLGTGMPARGSEGQATKDQSHRAMSGLGPSSFVPGQTGNGLPAGSTSMECFPLSYQGLPIGELRVAPRPGEDRLSARDRRLLEDLADQAGVALHAAGVTAELQRARERLVSAREEERRRLRRDLHDGLGPTLAALVAQAEAARDLVRSQPERSIALLGAIADQAEAATADIRRLVYDLRPPALDDLGLIGALSSQLAAHERPGLRLTLEAPADLPALPAAVEVAAYRIVLEAVTNLARHAGARTGVVCVAVGEQGDKGARGQGGKGAGGQGDRGAVVFPYASRLTPHLILTIRDDGRGVASGAQTGVGLRSMHERAEELGGTLELRQAPGGGTLVRAVIPL